MIAWDTDRNDWRSFRVDRIDGTPRCGADFTPRPVPPDVAARLERGIAYAPFACRITLRLQGSVDELQAALPVWCGVLEAETDTHSLLRVGADSPEGLLAQVLIIGREAELVEGETMVSALRQVLGRIATVLNAKSGPDRP